jgi:predicted O-methyltransferase YrrM
VAILQEHVEAYLHGVQPERSPVMSEMEGIAERSSVPIVHWETGRFLASLCRAADPRVLEVGTAIGYSALHMAEQLEAGHLVTLERDPARAAQARELLDRAGAGERVEIVEGDANDTLGGLQGPFDLVFLDATKGEYRDYLEAAEPLCSERCLLAVDNLLMSGEVGLSAAESGRWGEESLAAARRFNSELLVSERWLGSVLPIGDGVGFAARR